MKLSQLECPVDLNLAEDLSSLLEEEALSVSWYEQTPEKWSLQIVCDPSMESVLEGKIKAFFEVKRLPLPFMAMKILPQKDWVAAVYRGLSPLTIGEFYIYGSHIQEAPPKGFLPLRIDAATAFGSGQHESTEGCLKALSLIAEEGSFSAPLDMGCGSGILALAMASLWRVPVLACDNDPEAVRVTLENARLNDLKDFIEARVSEGFSSLKSQSFDIITANILAGPLCHMAGEASRVLAPRGVIILAGLLNRQAQDVIDAYRSAGTRLMNQLFIGDWSTLIMRKESHG